MLSFSMAAQVLAAPLPALSADRIIQSFSLDIGRVRCRRSGPKGAHLEAFNPYFFEPEFGETAPKFEKHAQAAATIFYDRANFNEKTCHPVYLLDVVPFHQTNVLKSVMQNFDVVTVSSVIGMTSALNPDQKGPAPLFPYAVPIGSKSDDSKSFLPLAPEFWDRVSDTIIVRAASNEFLDPRQIKITALDKADTLIVVGALEEHAPAIYSAPLAPDLIWYTGFDQGFSYPYYATQQEIFSLSARYNRPVNAPPYRLAGQFIRNWRGTSFATPDIGAFVLKARAHYPQLTSHEITIAAYLATSRQLSNKQDFRSNARGVPFDIKSSAGHGAFLPSVFEKILQDLVVYKARGGKEMALKRITASADAVNNRVRIQFKDQESIMRSIGVLAFERLPGQIGVARLNAFPQNVRMISPSGTPYSIPLQITADEGTDRSFVLAGFTVSGWLGEQASGAWTIVAPNGFTLKKAELTHIGAESSAGNTLDWLVDHAQEYFRNNPEADVIAMDTSPWPKESPAQIPRSRPPQEMPPALLPHDLATGQDKIPKPG